MRELYIYKDTYVSLTRLGTLPLFIVRVLYRHTQSYDEIFAAHIATIMLSSKSVCLLVRLGVCSIYYRST